MPLRSEFQSIVDAAGGDEPLNVRIHNTVRQSFNVVGLLLEADENVDELSNEAVAAANALLSKLNLGMVARRIAASAIPWVVPPAIEAMAQFSGTAEEFVETNVVPRLDLWIDTLTDIRADLKGKS
jgi:hypothetical protein